MSTAEVRLTTQTGPSHPHPGVGGVSTSRRPNATVGGGFRLNPPSRVRAEGGEIRQGSQGPLALEIRSQDKDIHGLPPSQVFTPPSAKTSPSWKPSPTQVILLRVGRPKFADP
ncbi:MAG: hypothetical protein GX934_12835 [Burkholderiales bacterium]|nr:hypothetical protein [Burkholderiales bacterium]